MNRTLHFIAAPILVAVYGLVRIVDGVDGERGPGLAWTVGHVAFLAALVLFVPILWDLRRRAGAGHLATTNAVMGVAGAVFTMTQIGIDIVIGMLAADHSDMQRLFHDVQRISGFALVVYDVGPPLFYLGLSIAVCQLTAMRSLPVWSAVVLLAGVFVSMIDLNLLPLGGLLMFVALQPLARVDRVNRNTGAAVPL